MLTNALQLRVMSTPTVLTPMVHTTVLVNQDIPETGTVVQVRYIIQGYCILLRKLD